MRGKLAVMLAAGVLGACASAGGFPKSLPMESSNTISQATQAIADAQTAGADSLASESLSNAKMHLDQAQKEQISRRPDEATLHAREALADARLAKTTALRMKAEHEQAAAQSALSALPQNGGSR
jgi:Domain of unknown function (DUF4398)